MSVISRMKSMAGDSAQIPTLASATTLVLQSGFNRYILTGSATITSISATTRPGREVTFIRGPAATDIPVFTNTQGTTTAGQIDLNSSVSTVQLWDTLTLVHMNNGSWRKLDSTTV